MFDVKKISPQEFSALLNTKGQIIIIDVNEDQDNRSYRMKIPHVPFSELEEHIDQLDKGTPLLLVCRYGERSFFGASMLINTYGFKDVMSLQGGLESYYEYLEENSMSNQN